MAFKRDSFSYLFKRKPVKRKYNWFEREFFKYIRNKSHGEKLEMFDRLNKAFYEGIMLGWDTLRENTKNKIIIYFESILSGERNEELAEELNRAPDIYTCLAWVDVVLFTENIIPF